MNSRLNVAASFISIMLLCCSCATVPLQDDASNDRSKRFEPPPPGWSGLYIFRPHVLLGQAWSWENWVDGQYIGRAASGTYFHRWVRPGTHRVQNRLVALWFEAKDGENTYLEESLIPGGYYQLIWRLQQVLPEEGRSTIGKLYLITPQDNKDRDLKDADYGEGKGSVPAFSVEAMSTSPTQSSPTVAPTPLSPPPELQETPSPKADSPDGADVGDTAATPTAAPHVTNLSKQLETLKSLYDKGLVSKEEYESLCEKAQTSAKQKENETDMEIEK